MARATGGHDHTAVEEREETSDGEPPQRTPPNPCAPPEKDPCDCNKPPTTTYRPERPKRPPPRRNDCCEQLIELIQGLPGMEGRKPHKPKQRPARKVEDLCALGIADAILPLLSVLWQRHEDGEEGRNAFEKKVENIFDSLDTKDAKAFGFAFEQYRKLRQSGKGECLFNDCLADAAAKDAVERAWVAEELIREGLKLAGQTVFRNSGGVMGPGQIRLWDNKVFHGPNGSGATIFQGPWPWLTAIAPDLTSYEEFGNLESFRPVPGGSHLWQNYQYAQDCTFAPDPAGKIVANCNRQHPPPAPPGALIGNYCEGGANYTHANDCLRIPAQKPGGSIKLRGFNFITPTVKVRIARVGDPTVVKEEECTVWGDQVTPLKDDKGHFIVDERVSDWVDCPIPSAHPTIPGAPLPAGLYEVSVHVANVTNSNYDGSVPPILVTNKLLIKLEADPNLKYLVWSNRGRCNRETPGMGDDEIWWDAFVGHIVPKEVPVPTTGASALELKMLERRSFPRPPWEDMDDGESAGAYSIDVWGPRAFELYGVAVIGIVGFEVDSEASARDQLQGFWNAWGKALTEVATVAISGAGLIEAIAKFVVGVTITVALIILAVVAAVVLICTAFWAAWAPADLIALDVMHFDASNAWDRADPMKPLPPPTTRLFDDPYADAGVSAQGSVLITVTETPLPRDHKKGDAAATWIQEVQYDTPEHGEDASYMLEFRMART